MLSFRESRKAAIGCHLPKEGSTIQERIQSLGFVHRRKPDSSDRSHADRWSFTSRQMACEFASH